MQEETLQQTADKEANEAEAAIAEGAKNKADAKKGGKKAKADPKVAGKIEPLIGTETKPGAQGTATQEDDDFKAPDYVPPDPTREQVKNATSVFQELQSRARDMGAERVIEALLQVVDTHPEFITPMEWPGEKEDEYRESSVVQRIASFLISGCPKIEISPRKVVCLWRQKESWQSKGVTIRSDAKSFSKLTRFLTEGAYATIEVNYNLFRHMNPLQKIFTIYDALRHLDNEGKMRPHDFDGFFDEVELFGPAVFQEMVSMVNALERGKDRALPYQLSLLDEIDEETAD